MDGLHVSVSQTLLSRPKTSAFLSENGKISPTQALGAGAQGTVTIAIPARGIWIHIYRGLQDASGPQDRTSQGQAHWQVKNIHAFCLVQTSGRIETTNLRCQVCNHGLWPCCDCGTRIQKGWLVLLVERLFTAEYNRVQRPFVDLFTIFKELFWRLFHSGYYFTVETEQQSTLETCD